MTLEEKYEKLGEILGEAGSVLVAFSGGVDSSLLAKAAFDGLGEKALAVTIKSAIHPDFELREAEEIAAAIGIRHLVVEADMLEVEGFCENTPERCYICKRAILTTLLGIAAREGLGVVAEGSNASDGTDFRPGRRAVAELGVMSPLAEAGLSKGEIRELSRREGLVTFDKPSYACLASRVPYGEEITGEKLTAIDRGEELLRARGYRIVRVRHHGALARIELGGDELGRFMAEEDAAEIARAFKELGFTYVTVDLEGYRTGSLNETLGGESA